MRDLAAELGYQHRRPNPVERWLRAFAGSRPGAWFLSKSLRHLDKAILRATRGTRSATELLVGLPVIVLTTTGARTGRARQTPLLGVPFEGVIAVGGANFGQRATPAWVYNLMASPEAEVSYRNRHVPVTARLATEAEAAAITSAAGVIYPGSLKYVERVRWRPIRIFLLERTSTLPAGSSKRVE